MCGKVCRNGAYPQKMQPSQSTSRRWLRSAVAVAACASSLLLVGCGGTDSSSNAATYFDPTQYSSNAAASLAQARELASTTHHQIVINGTTLAYHATAGHLTVSSPTTGAPEASIFYVAYILEPANATTRPLTFFYNGGPGSSTIWLHLGSFGPKRLVTGDPSTTAVSPFPLVDNAESLLDTTDLVFVDAVGTGFSEAVAPNTNLAYWGVDADGAIFRDFVVRYLAVNARAASPLFLFGESYGTTRSALLAFLLETAGVRLNGVILQSSILNYNSNCGVTGNAVVSCGGYVPSYGAIGAYYQLDVPNPTDAALPAFVAQMRALTISDYQPAVTQFLASGAVPNATLLDTLGNTTGLSAQKWGTNFNLGPDVYQPTLIAGTLIGIYDARVSAPLLSPLAQSGDPSSSFITPSFANAIDGYLAVDLQYTTPSRYTALSNALQVWTFAHDGLALPDVLPDLAAALALNPNLRVLSLNGYYDLATPFFQTETDLARLGVNANVQTTFYRAGHMTYLDDQARIAEKADLVQFYQRASARQ